LALTKWPPDSPALFLLLQWLSPSPFIGFILWLIITILSIFLLLNNSKKAYLWLVNALGFLIFIPSFLLPNAKIYDFLAQPQIIQELNLAKNSYTILDKQGVYKLIRLKLSK
jgi:hypothetical protein